jgi:hypothetical protein
MSRENLDLVFVLYDLFNRRDLDGFLAYMDKEIEIESRLVAMEGSYDGHEGGVAGGTTCSSSSPTTRSGSRRRMTSATWSSPVPAATGTARRTGGFGREGKPDFWITDQRVPTTENVHVAFEAPDRATVDAFHTAPLEAGGSDNGAPGIRDIYHPHYYGA